MDFTLKLRALERLVSSQAPGAEAVLRKELVSVSDSLRATTGEESSDVSQALELLEHLAPRFPRDVLEVVCDFIKAARATIQVPAYVLVKAIELVIRLRHVETKRVFAELLDLAADENDSIRKKAREGLIETVRPDLDVIHGAGAGASIQAQVIEELEKIDIAESRIPNVLVEVTSEILTPTMEATRWATSTTVMISKASVPAQVMSDVRDRAVGILQKFYARTGSLALRARIISALREAASGPDQSTPELDAVIARDTKRVLAFFADLVATADLPIVQKIENTAYWMYYHAGDIETKNAALKVRDAIADRHEYAIYKTLIGFEGIFGDWTTLRAGDEDFEGQDKWRREVAVEFARSITDHNFEQWRSRILLYSTVESEDLATFPVFYFFLEEFAKASPTLALRLLRENDVAIARFLIPVLRGLWATDRIGARDLVSKWIAEGKHLAQIARQFIGVADTDVELLRDVLNAAQQRDDIVAVANVVSAAAASGGKDPRAIQELFVPALRIFTEKQVTWWVNDVWFRRELRALIPTLDEQTIDLLMRNLAQVEKIGHQVEELLFAIAQRHPKRVIDLLAARVEQDEAERRSAFDALPYKMHKLDKALAKEPAAVVAASRQLFAKKSPLFEYRGARLVKTIFPALEQPASDELLRIISSGQEEDLMFVASVLLAYDGELFIYPLSKEIIRRAPADSQVRDIVARALWKSGVVAGAYGVAEAFERKAAQMATWLEDPEPGVRAFATERIEEFNQDALAERQRAKESVALRRHRFGEDEPEPN